VQNIPPIDNRAVFATVLAEEACEAVRALALAICECGIVETREKITVDADPTIETDAAGAQVDAMDAQDAARTTRQEVADDAQETGTDDHGVERWRSAGE
jgi:hypothetical protein